MSDKDLSYYRDRAVTELERAQQASCPEAAAAHRELAAAYLERITAPKPAGQTGHA